MDTEITGQQAEATNAGAATAAQQASTATSADPGAPAPGQQGSPVSTADLHAQQPAAAAAGAGQAPAAGSNPAAAATDAAAAAAQTAATPQTWDSARAYAASLGLQGASQYQDDQQFIQALAQQAQQAQTYQQQLNFLSQQFAGYLQNQRQQPQQAQAPAAPPEKPKLWSPPEYQPQWEALVRKDEQGNLSVVPGAPPDILPKYMAYHQYRRDFADKLLTNPVETLNPLIEERSQAIADQAIQKHLQTYQDQVWTDNFIQQNSSWLHARDAAGNVVRNAATGRPSLSPEGARFQEHVVYAERQLGITDIRKQETYARSMLQRDLAVARLQPQQAAQQGAQLKDQVIQQGNRNPNRAGSLFQTGNPAPQPAQNASLSLRDQLTQQLAAAGFSLDQTV